MKIGLYSNLTRDNDAVITKAVFNLLADNGLEPFVSDELSGVDFGRHTPNFLTNTELAKNSEFVVVLGGDGTILRIAKECAKHKTPIYAVNVGTKGFLSEINKNELNKIITDVVNKDYILDNRKFLKVKISNSEEEFYALNEVVVCEAQCAKVLRAEITVNDTMVDKYTSDGIIVATPTGSTAYSLSAGGPIVAPDVNCFLITPVCAHSLHSRPMIVSNTSTVKVKITDGKTKASVNIDGEHIKNITLNDSVEVVDSDLYVSFVRRKSFNFYEKLLGKMRYWSSIEV